SVPQQPDENEPNTPHPPPSNGGSSSDGSNNDWDIIGGGNTDEINPPNLIIDNFTQDASENSEEQLNSSVIKNKDKSKASDNQKETNKKTAKSEKATKKDKEKSTADESEVVISYEVGTPTEPTTKNSFEKKIAVTSIACSSAVLIKIASSGFSKLKK
ncbi:MAG: hypothetical protein RR048_03350, partial [Oscillospiraceae bacterium]